MNRFDALTMVLRYITLWNERDAVAREVGVRELWAPDGALINARKEYRGHDAVLEAVTRSFERFIANGYRYRARDGVQEHHGGVYVPWEMLDSHGTVVSCGPNFLQLDRHDRIKLDYQFVER